MSGLAARKDGIVIKYNTMELNSELNRLLKYSDIDSELGRAKKLHPDFPKDPFRQLAIMQEEAGEVAKAVNDCTCGKDTIEHIREELTQTAAMCVRMLENLPKNRN